VLGIINPITRALTLILVWTDSHYKQENLKDMSNELIIRWNGPNISKCDSVVMQALNFHFEVDLGTFSSDVQS